MSRLFPRCCIHNNPANHPGDRINYHEALRKWCAAVSVLMPLHIANGPPACRLVDRIPTGLVHFSPCQHKFWPNLEVSWIPR